MKIRESKDNAYLVVPEDSDDLFALRRIIRRNDLIVTDTSRVVKQVKEFARPDRGERVRIRIALNVEAVSLDSAVDRLRVKGVIVNSDNELVPRGAHHSHTIKIGDVLSLEKARWDELDLKILQKAGSTEGIVLVSIDRTEAAIGRISGTHLQMVANVYSGFSGKMYKTKEESIDSYFKDVMKVLNTFSNEGDSIIIFGPGGVKNRFYNLLTAEKKSSNGKISVVDGVDVAGEDGIYVFIRSDMINEVIGSSKMAAASSILKEIMTRISTSDNRVAFGFNDVRSAIDYRAVESLIFSDAILATINDEAVIELLNKAELQGASVFALDSSTDIGSQTSSLGGIAALLRFPIS